MAYFISEIDADFYRFIHEWTGPQSEEEPAESRRAGRHPFPARHRIAPCRGPAFPEDGEFFEVRCHDLTRAGFSFYLPARPDFTSLVAAFRGPSGMIYVAAEIAHCGDVILYPSGLVEHVGDPAGAAALRGPDGETGTPMVLVGCRFTHKVQKPVGKPPKRLLS